MAKLGRPEVFSDEEIEEALRKSHGLLASAARFLSAGEDGRTITRKGVERRVNKSEHLTEVLQEENDSLLDFAESKLYQNIKDGDKTSLIFYLKCKGKERGYVERGEIVGKQDVELSGNIGVATIADLMLENYAKNKGTKNTDS